MIKTLFLLLILCSQAGYSQSEREGKINELINVITEELEELERLSNTNSGSDPQLLLRMAELNMEKARLLNQKENNDFLNLSVEKRKAISKENQFRNSRSFYSKAQRLCHLILEKHKNFVDKSKVYYLLALNSREFGDEKNSKAFLNNSIKSSRSGDKINLEARLQLADISFSENNFQESFELYHSTLAKSGDQDKWWTKNAYNMAWSAYKLKNYDFAIETMKKVLILSKNPQYIDMSSYVVKNLALLYAQSNQINEGIRFYKEINQDINNHLISLARSLLEKGKLTDVEEVLIEAGKLARSDEEKQKVNLMFLETYERLGNSDKHLPKAKELAAYFLKNQIKDGDVETLVYHAEKIGAELQKEAIGNEYSYPKETRMKKAKKAIEYFEIVSALSKEKAFKYKYYKAETYFAIEDYKSSMNEYKNSFDFSIQEQSREFQKRSLDGMLTILKNQQKQINFQDEDYLDVYLRYLKYDEKSAQSKKIYQKVFSILIDHNNITKAEEILVQYQSNFSQDQETLEVFLAKILDYYKSRKDQKGISKWIDEIKSGKFALSEKFNAKLDQYLLAMEFEKVEQVSATGDKKSAIQGYIDLFNKDSSLNTVKKNAAYNLSILYLDLNDYQQSYDWALKAINLMNPEDIKKFENSFLVMIVSFFQKRNLIWSANISTEVLKKLCLLNSINKTTFYKNAILLNIVENRSDEALSILKLSNKCSIESDAVENSKFDLANAMVKEQRWSTVIELIDSANTQSQNMTNMIKPYAQTIQAFYKTGNLDQARNYERKIVEIYQHAKKKNASIELENLDIIAEMFEKQVRKRMDELFESKLEFPESKFNEVLKKKLMILDEITKLSMEIVDIGSGRGIVSSYKNMVSSYKKIVIEVTAFTPPSQSESYIDSFKKNMQQISGPIAQKANLMSAEAKEHILKNSILSEENWYFLNNGNNENNGKKSFNIIFPVEQGILMDRGGRN